MKTIVPLSLVLMLGIAIIFTVCNSTEKDAANILKITKDDGKMILEYLDTKTDDIMPSKDIGKVYSAFKVLGTDKNKIYIWLVKLEYVRVENTISHENRDAVSLPVVLNIKKKDQNLEIISHNYPKDGKNYGKNKKKLFPPNIEFPSYNDKMELIEITKVRAEQDLKREL